MRRYGAPYYGKRFLLNTNTYEVHDLDNEKDNCRINEIRLEHIEMFDTLLDVKVRLAFLRKKLNGCYYCLTRFDIG